MSLYQNDKDRKVLLETFRLADDGSTVRQHEVERQELKRACRCEPDFTTDNSVLDVGLRGRRIIDVDSVVRQPALILYFLQDRLDSIAETSQCIGA